MIIGVLGLGYVGLPLCREFVEAGVSVLGFDVDRSKVDAIEKKKGVIEISTGMVENKSGLVFIDVKDNGKGISAQNRRMIFKPGFSTKKRGWGLGLNLAKRIVEEFHNGKLSVKDSRHGEGTTMRIILKG